MTLQPYLENYLSWCYDSTHEVVERIRAKTIVPLQDKGWSNKAIGNCLRSLEEIARKESRWTILPPDIRADSRRAVRVWGKAASQVLRRE